MYSSTLTLFKNIEPRKGTESEKTMCDVSLNRIKKITQTECRAQPQTCGIELDFIWNF